MQGKQNATEKKKKYGEAYARFIFKGFSLHLIYLSFNTPVTFAYSQKCHP